jgi:hypothetical protein
MSSHDGVRFKVSGLLLWLALGPAAAMAGGWRVSADQTTLVCTTSASKCARIAAQFLDFTRLLRYLAAWDADYTPQPLVVFDMTADQANVWLLTTADRRENGIVGSKLLPGSEQTFAAIVESPEMVGENSSLQGMLLLYAQSIMLTGPTARYPPWYPLGISELVNGVILRNGGVVYFDHSAPFQPVLKTRQASARYDLKHLLEATAADLSGGDYREFLRRARSWAEFGLLMTPEQRAQYQELGLLMRQGADAEEAVQKAFGRPFSQVETEFEDGHWRKSAQFRLNLPGTSAPVPAVENVDGEQVNALLAQLKARAGEAHSKP